MSRYQVCGSAMLPSSQNPACPSAHGARETFPVANRALTCEATSTPSSSLRPVQRFDAVGVARRKPAPGNPIPDDEGEHAAQARQHRRPLLREQGQQHFGIRTGAERSPLRRQLVAQFPEVVDFAVEDNDVTPADRVHRLIGPRVEIENGQAAVAEPDTVLLPRAFGIGATAVHGIQCRQQLRFVNCRASS